MTNSSLTTPVLLMIYNRPDLTSKVFEQIKAARPGNLFIAADGPKPHHHKDDELCKITRSITENIDWDCQVFRLYRSVNLGCKTSVSESITWFFNHVEEGIILEDDCVPHPDFFRFCSDMLNEYRNDSSIGHISGNNFFPDKPNTIHTHRITRYPYIWGWATWRRVWKDYHVNPLTKENFKWNQLSGTFSEKINLLRNLTLIHADRLSTWDFQYHYLLWKQKLKTVIPTQNLVSNIGFDERATHTRKVSKNSARSREPLSAYAFNKKVFHISMQDEIHEKISGKYLLGKHPVLILFKFLKDYPVCRTRIFLNNLKLSFKKNLVQNKLPAIPVN